MTEPNPAGLQLIETGPLAVVAPGFKRTRDAIYGCMPTNTDAADACVFDELRVQLDCAGRRVTVTGELDSAGAPVLAEVMKMLLAANPGDSIVDLTGVSMIGAAALGVLVDFGNQLAATGAKVSVAGATPRVRRVFDLVGLDALLEAS